MLSHSFASHSSYGIKQNGLEKMEACLIDDLMGRPSKTQRIGGEWRVVATRRKKMAKDISVDVENRFLTTDSTRKKKETS